MTDQSTELTDLIADARLVLAYAARTGRLPSKSLAEAVAHASSGPADNTSTEDRFMALTSALNESMRGIAPITLYDLGSKYQPYPSSKGGRFKRIAFSILAVVLVVVTAYYTQVYSQVNSILLALRDIQTQNATDKAERLFRFTLKHHQDLFSLTEKKAQIGKQGQGEKKDEEEIIFEPYLKFYLDLLRLNDQLSTYIPLSLAITSEIAHPLSTIYSLVRSDEADVTLLNQLDYRGGNYDPPEAKKDQPSEVKKDQPPLVQDKAKNDDAVPVDKKLINKQLQLTGFLFSLGLYNFSPSISNYISTQIYECQKLSSILGIWMLPALYGLLGAVVFQMRAILDPLIPDPPLERLLIRFSLGVLAGVSISWLFASTPGATPAKLFEAQSVNTTLFGVSFLLGFSIDVFFSLLDRAVEKLSDTIAKKNAIDKKGK